jgi:hypothetical protein
MMVSSGERDFVRLVADDLFVSAEERRPYRLDPLQGVLRSGSHTRFLPDAGTPTGHETYALVGLAGVRWILRMSPWWTMTT